MELALPDVKLFELGRREDDRGEFMEIWRADRFAELGPFVQDNWSRSKLDVLRGLHYQIGPDAQGKLIRVMRGQILDVVVDLRKASSTFGNHVTVILDEKTPSILWVPPGFAHGFLARSAGVELLYKVTAHHAPQSERTLLWNDPALGIKWGCSKPRLSLKDQNGALLRDAETFP